MTRRTRSADDCPRDPLTRRTSLRRCADRAQQPVCARAFERACVRSLYRMVFVHTAPTVHDLLLDLEGALTEYITSEKARAACCARARTLHGVPVSQGTWVGA